MTDGAINGEGIQKIINKINQRYSYNFSKENTEIKNIYNMSELVNNMIQSSDRDIDEESNNKKQITFGSICQYKKDSKLWLYKNSLINKEINSNVASMYEKTMKDFKIIKNLINKKEVSVPNRDEMLYLVGHPITKVLFPNEYNNLCSTQKKELNAKMVNNTNFKYQLEVGNISSINDNEFSEEEEQESDFEISRDISYFVDEEENDN